MKTGFRILNPGKCRFISIGKDTHDEEEILGLIRDRKLTFHQHINPLSANPTKWSNTLKQFVGKLATNCLSVFLPFCGIGA